MWTDGRGQLARRQGTLRDYKGSYYQHCTRRGSPKNGGYQHLYFHKLLSVIQKGRFTCKLWVTGGLLFLHLWCADLNQLRATRLPPGHSQLKLLVTLVVSWDSFSGHTFGISGTKSIIFGYIQAIAMGFVKPWRVNCKWFTDGMILETLKAICICMKKHLDLLKVEVEDGVGEVCTCCCQQTSSETCNKHLWRGIWLNQARCNKVHQSTVLPWWSTYNRMFTQRFHADA